MSTLALAVLVLSAPPASDAAALAATIDGLVAAKLRAAELPPPTAVADDATFFRRVHLTLAGRIPTAADARAFLADPDPHKREREIDRLLGSAAHAGHLAAAWRAWLLPEAATDPAVATTAPGFEAWVRTRVRAGQPYDQFVTELLAAPFGGSRPTTPDGDDPAAGPLAFFTAKGAAPENLAAATARVFMAVQMDCAQCHDHPFARWTRDQFWGLAAFFGGLDRSGGTLREKPGRRELLIPNTDRAVTATLPDDTEPEWRFKQSPRATLAGWLTAADNPYFATAAVNRLWGFAFGVGLTDPVDDRHDTNPPSHPELLDALARAFVASGYDTKLVLRAVCRSDTFQRPSTLADPGHTDVRLFARFPVQGLTPEQLADSFAAATGGPADRRPFTDAFPLLGRRTEAPTTIAQSLALMNGPAVGAATTPAGSRTLVAVTTLPGLTPAERVECLYFAALGRPPTARELARATAADPPPYADLFWALLNGIEFRTNH